MLAACQGTQPGGVGGWGWRHHPPFSWTSTSLWSDWSSSLVLTFLPAATCQRPSLCFTLLFCPSPVPSLSSSYLSSSLSRWGSGLGPTGKQGQYTREERLNDFVALSWMWMFIRAGTACCSVLPVVWGISQTFRCLWSYITPPLTYCELWLPLVVVYAWQTDGMTQWWRVRQALMN